MKKKGYIGLDTHIYHLNKNVCVCIYIYTHAYVIYAQKWPDFTHRLHIETEIVDQQEWVSDSVRHIVEARPSPETDLAKMSQDYKRHWKVTNKRYFPKPFAAKMFSWKLDSDMIFPKHQKNLHHSLWISIIFSRFWHVFFPWYYVLPHVLRVPRVPRPALETPPPRFPLLPPLGVARHAPCSMTWGCLGTGGSQNPTRFWGWFLTLRFPHVKKWIMKWQWMLMCLIFY